MKSFVINIAGLKIKIEHIYGLIKDYCEGYYDEDDNFDFAVSVYRDDIEKEKIKYIEECESEKKKPSDLTDAEYEITAVYRKIADKIIDYDALVFHGSALSVNGEGYIFTAKSGTGKTTHTNLWLKNIPGTLIVNGDKPIIRIKNSQVFVCGTPWSGKERFNSNTSVPVKAICKLTRGNENKIEKISFSDMLPVLLQQSHIPDEKQGLVKIMNIFNAISRSTGFYVLECNMLDEASFVAYGGMSK